MKSSGIRIAVLAALALLFLTGCSWFGNQYDIEIKNFSNGPADFWYRESGASDWEWLTSVLEDGTAYESLQGGTYDFRAMVALADVTDDGFLLGEETDCTLDFQFDSEGDGQTYDYSLKISQDSLVFF